MGELKRRIIQFLYRLLPQKEIQLDKEEFNDINEEHKLLRGLKGSDKIKVAKHMDRHL